MRRLALIGVLAMNWMSTGFGGEIDFVEDFVLAKDRAAVLKQLVPGTEEFSYYHALHYLQTEQFDKIDGLIADWVQRHGETQRVWEIRTRYSLATYDNNPQKTLKFLRERLGLNYLHQKEELNQEPNLPTTLDPALISHDAYLKRANAVSTNNTNLFEDTALDWLVKTELGTQQRRSLLSRISRPDYETLAKLVIDELKQVNSGGFGTMGIHRQLLIPQLEELAKGIPDLLNNQNFVLAYLTKLQPTADEDWQRNLSRYEAYLDRLAKFTNRLAPVHNSLKAHVLYHRLMLDRQRGNLNKERFVEYLKLPRRVGYLSKRISDSDAFKNFPCDLNANYVTATLLPPVGDDESLVRSYLAAFLVDAPNTKEFDPYLNDIYLQQLFAEVKIVNGLGDAEQWASQLPPARFQQLKDRVDLDFAFTNKTQFAPDEPVKLDLFLKNVGTLIVKVFEINARSFYRTQLKEIDTDISLDGLVANVEQTYPPNASPLRRVPVKLEFSELEKPGIYVVDFIGNGRSSRALIRKGRLRYLVRTGPVGHVFTILNEKNEQVKDATLWLSGHEYLPGADGAIQVPFAAKAGRQPIVISQGGLSSLDFFQQEAETFNLTAGFYVDRESLLKQKTAELIVRAGLSLNGTPASLKLLDDVKLTIISTDLEGIVSSKEIPDFKLFEDRDSTHEFQVPARLASLQFTLTGRAKKLSEGGRKIDLSAGDSVALNGIDRTEKIEFPHLARFGDSYVIELRGKTGEPKSSRPVQLAFKHRDFRNTFPLTLKTNAAGRIELGPLNDIVSITATTPENTQQSWALRGDSHTYFQTVHGKVGEPIVVPYISRRSSPAENAVVKPTREELSLLEVRSDVFVADRFEHISLKDGLVVLNKLPAGDYDLLLKSSGAQMRIRVTDGPRLAGFILGNVRQLELPRLAPLQIESIASADGNLSIKLKNATKFTRVHVFASRYVPEYDVFTKFSRVYRTEPYVFQQTPAKSVYLTGRNIGDEYRYIIERKYAKKFPGNTLDRPSLLLNPWAIRSSETGEQEARGGDQFAKAGAAPMSAASRSDAASDGAKGEAIANLADLDFLAQGSVTLTNLIPDGEGVIKIEKDALGPHQHIHVVAVDPVSTTYRSISLLEPKTDILDLRLLSGLDPKGHFTQQKQVSIVPVGQTFTLHDITTSKFEAYDSLSRVFSLYATLSQEPKLNEFSFILNWPDLKLEEKRTLYSKHASHELSFFLFKKDPEFFQMVIKPYLANKKDKTFIDRFLLEDDLSEYLKPWQYQQLNIVERILLAQRVKDERPHAARHVSDHYALLPPNTENFIRLFETAVKRSSLETSDAFGFREASDRLSDKIELQLEEKFADKAPAVPRSMTLGRPEVAAFGGLRSKRQLSEQDAKERQLEAASRSTNRRESSLRKGDDKSKSEIANGITKSAIQLDNLSDAEHESLFFDSTDSPMQAPQLRQLYRKLDQTMEWAENNYHHLTIDQQHAGLVTVNAFWKDFAQHDPVGPFLSRNLAEASHNFPEMLLALAVLDLPFKSPKHETKFDGPNMTLTPGGPLVVFHEEIKPTAAADTSNKVLISQNFFRYGDRTRLEAGEQVDKFVTDEFLRQVVYGCQVVVTNPTSTRQKLNVLLQIPVGSIPVLNSLATQTVHISLEPYHTQTLDYHFYFPGAGQFAQFPVHVARNESLIASTPAVTLNVVDKPTKIDTGSWDYVSQFGSTDDVLMYLDKNNIDAINLDRIVWRMHDPKAFVAVLEKLTQRHVYQHTLWSYALKHNIPERVREYLMHADQIVSTCRGRLASRLLTIDPVARRTFEHLEYKPLVNARAHSLGKRRQILNDRFHHQYHETLHQLSYERKLDDDDLLTVTYYLLLQDRIEEALATFARVNVDKVSTKMQYDYCAAYLDFFTEDHQKARRIADKYTDHPVDRWRETFAAISAQLDESEGKDAKLVSDDDRNQQQTQLAATEPNFDFNVEAKQIKLDSQNMKSARINFYEMDVELLFSRNPFVQHFSGQFSSIKPNRIEDVTLDERQNGADAGRGNQSTKLIPLPAELNNKNVLVEIVGAGSTKTQAYYSHSLSVQVIENYGQVKVTHQTTGKPVPKAYVKVYAQMRDGSVRFYKDGYTDLRGRFDFASLNTNALDIAKKFSILILSDEFGALVREANPPKR
jgi:hypothetical protein